MKEMVLLNTKNAELNTMNNDLSRRVSEREREAVAFMAGTNFLDNQDKKPNSRNSDTCNTTPMLNKKNSSSGVGGIVGGIGEEGLTKIKKLKNRGLMFGKFGNKQNGPQRKSSSNNNKYGNGSSTSGNGGTESPYTLSESESTSTIPETRSVGSADNYSSSNHGDSIAANDEHSLYQIKFIRPVRCEVCGDKIWRSSELKCQG
ncbi:hypothetical protein BDB00DRAFT_907019 [Zychaea mexicana]|uniref:uncharacterized protein n=1 Tax=Zychaea mexicana TaxID=64656 RepID=UPI0022FDDF94|nr:uncharacterized protein BDB00DRAFT_907019 [Zychaea mexicana]KAI9493450.1 hypothetical protein BDB00DRAFT_907019 [Zychaea mexicana]